MSSIYVPDELKARLIRAARRRGFSIERGRQSQLTEYIAYLVDLDETAGQPAKKRPTFAQASGLLARLGEPPPSDEEVADILDERRMRH
jgi:hypothetical protein